MLNTFDHASQSIDAIAPKPGMVFEVWKTLLSDQTEVFGIYCNGEEIYPATSEENADGRLTSLQNALSAYHIALAGDSAKTPINAATEVQVPVFNVHKSRRADGSEVFEICCNGAAIYTAYSASDAEERCNTMLDAISPFHVSFGTRLAMNLNWNPVDDHDAIEKETL